MRISDWSSDVCSSDLRRPDWRNGGERVGGGKNRDGGSMHQCGEWCSVRNQCQHLTIVAVGYINRPRFGTAANTVLLGASVTLCRCRGTRRRNIENFERGTRLIRTLGQNYALGDRKSKRLKSRH